MNITFAGLGVMGGPIAGYLVRAGHSVTGFNRSFERAERWAEAQSATVERDFEASLSSAEALVLCVGNDDDVRGLVTRALAVLPAGALIVDHTTTSARLAIELSGLAAGTGIDFVDAPVSGGQAGAEAGQLSIMAGGTEGAYARAEPLFAAYGKSWIRIGDSGAGQSAKMCNQIAIAGTVAAVAEALHFSRCAELDPNLVFEAISKGAAGSWQMSNRWASMSEDRYDFGFAVDWMRKDLGFALDEARRNGAHLSVTALVDQFYSEVQAVGGGRWDTSALHMRLQLKGLG